MGYQTFAHSPKSLIKAEDIGSGQIEVKHLSPALYTEIRKIPLHTHSGLGSKQVNLANLTGAFTSGGFLMYSPNGKLWQIKVDNTGTLTTTEIT